MTNKNTMTIKQSQNTYVDGVMVKPTHHTEARATINDRYEIGPLTYSNHDSFCKNERNKVREEIHGNFIYHIYKYSSGDILAFYIPKN